MMILLCRVFIERNEIITKYSQVQIADFFKRIIMSYLTFKLISITVLVVIMLIILVANRNSKKDTKPNDSSTAFPHEQEDEQTSPYYKFPEKQSEGITEKKIEISDAVKRENRRFTKAYLGMSEWERNKIRGEDNPRTPEEEKAYWEEFERRKKEHYELLKKHPDNHHHCVGFDLPTAAEAYDHFHGMLEELWDYGDMCNGHCLHTWDDGGRKLYLCHDCGGLVLVQKSEYHGQENDDYYTDYFPVDSVQEAEQLNELYGGWAIEKEWKGKKVFVSKGHVTHNFR